MPPFPLPLCLYQKFGKHVSPCMRVLLLHVCIPRPRTPAVHSPPAAGQGQATHHACARATARLQGKRAICTCIRRTHFHTFSHMHRCAHAGHTCTHARAHLFTCRAAPRSWQQSWPPALQACRQAWRPCVGPAPGTGGPAAPAAAATGVAARAPARAPAQHAPAPRRQAASTRQAARLRVCTRT